MFEGLGISHLPFPPVQFCACAEAHWNMQGLPAMLSGTFCLDKGLQVDCLA